MLLVRCRKFLAKMVLVLEELAACRSPLSMSYPAALHLLIPASVMVDHAQDVVIQAGLLFLIYSFKHFDQHLMSQLRHTNTFSGRLTGMPSALKKPRPFSLSLSLSQTSPNFCILLILVLERKWNLSHCHTSFSSQYSVPSVCQVQKKSILWKIAKEVMIFVLNSLFCLSIKKATCATNDVLLFRYNRSNTVHNQNHVSQQRNHSLLPLWLWWEYNVLWFINALRSIHDLLQLVHPMSRGFKNISSY